MPKRPLKPCAYWGCSEVVPAGQRYCERHQKQKDKERNQARPSSVERGYDRDWQAVRDQKAAQDPLCERCLKRGIIKPLDQVHHIIPIDERPDLRLNMDNLKSLCRECHLEIHKEDRWRKRNI